MLILSRKKNEQIVISDDITITVLDVEGEKVIKNEWNDKRSK